MVNLFAHAQETSTTASLDLAYVAGEDRVFLPEAEDAELGEEQDRLCQLVRAARERLPSPSRPHHSDTKVPGIAWLSRCWVAGLHQRFPPHHPLAGNTLVFSGSDLEFCSDMLVSTSHHQISAHC